MKKYLHPTRLQIRSVEAPCHFGGWRRVHEQAEGHYPSVEVVEPSVRVAQRDGHRNHVGHHDRDDHDTNHVALGRPEIQFKIF